MDLTLFEKEIEVQVQHLQDKELIVFSKTIQELLIDKKHHYWIPLLSTLLRTHYYETYNNYDEINIQNLVYLARSIVNRTLNVRVNWQTVIQIMCNHCIFPTFVNVHNTNTLYDYFTTKLLRNMCKFLPFKNEQNVSNIVFRTFTIYKKNEYLINTDIHEIALFFYFHQEIKQYFPPTICEDKTILRRICIFLGVPSKQINEIIHKIVSVKFSPSEAFALQMLVHDKK